MAAFSTCLRGSRLPQNNTLCILVVLAVPPDFNSMCAPCSLFEGLFVAEQPRQKKGLEPKRYSELLSVSEALGGEVLRRVGGGGRSLWHRAGLEAM